MKCQSAARAFEHPDVSDPYSLNQYPRLKMLRHELLNAKKTVCVERARLLTEYFIRKGFDETRPVYRQALALRYVLEHLTPVLFEDELIVGSTTSARVGMVVYPEFLSLAVWPELPTMATRTVDPVALSDEDGDHLAQVVFPYWKDRTIIEYVRREGKDPESLRLTERILFFALTKANGISHLVPDFETLVSRGLASQIEQARKKEKSAPDETAAEFHRAVRICFESVIGLAERYAAACEQLAQRTKSPWADELMESARTLRRVPAEPAATLREAIQSIWITQVALHQENSNMAMSFGRVDQVLGPLYEADRAAGRIDEQRAAELIGCFFLKIGDHMPLAPLAGQDIIGGASTDQAVTVGGMKPDGTDGVNDVTYLMLNISAMLALREPNMCARLHAGSPPRYRRAVTESLYKNGAAPALYGDETIIKALCAHGISTPHARDYGVVGCVEPSVCYRAMGFTGAILFNLAAVLEITLNDGVHPSSGMQIGPATGRLADLTSYEAFFAAFEKQLAHLVDLSVDGNARFAQAHASLHPTPLLSSLIRGTAQSGKDVTHGGAMYNSSGVAVIGFADVVDSLAAIRQQVFEKRAIGLDELSEALAKNFVGYEKVHAQLCKKAPKYGTDDPVADAQAARLVEVLADAFDRHENPRGGRFHLGFWSATMHTGFGALIGALPNGRKKGAPLASGATPVSGVARYGPTASLASTQKLPAQRMANGIANNHKLSRSLLGRPGKLDVFQSLIEGYFKGGGMQVQFVIQDRQTLLDAQSDPDSYRDLLVRVSGYTAYFCDLNRSMQNEIIGRTEDCI